MRFLKRSIAALAVVVVAGGHPAEPVLAAQEQPDLQVEIVGLVPNSQRDVQIRVTNVSTWWADETTARVETVSPGPANVAPAIFVENLDPGQSTILTYRLAAACNNHVVKVVVPPAKNHAGVPEIVLGNNEISRPGHTGQVCGAGAPTGAERVTRPPGANPADVTVPLDRGIVSKPTGADATEMLPEHMRPGTHAADGQYPPLELDAIRVFSRQSRPSWCSPYDYAGNVGSHQADRTLVADCWWVAQTAVDFDLSLLDEVPNKTVREAVLTYRESHVAWVDGNGTALPVGNCVEVLGLATEAMQEQDEPSELFPNERVLGHTPGVQEWFVTSYVSDWVNNERPRFGFVLRGGNESPQGHDRRSCESKLDSIKLKVTYTIP